MGMGTGTPPVACGRMEGMLGGARVVGPHGGAHVEGMLAGARVVGSHGGVGRAGARADRG